MHPRDEKEKLETLLDTYINGPRDGALLSAEQGADRVAERRSNRQKPSRHGFCCENCSGTVFLVTLTSEESRLIRRTLACTCGNADDASFEEIREHRTRTEIGRLGTDHRTDYRDDEYGDQSIEAGDNERIDRRCDCSDCHEQGSPEDWEIEVLEDWEATPEELHIEVACASCGHEIEFGYSHAPTPGVLEGGRIWPCESSDFNPWKTFPDPRFKARWERRGWIRPS